MRWWSLCSGGVGTDVTTVFNPWQELTTLCWGDNGKSFYAAYEGGILAVWNLKTTSKPDYMGKPTIDGEGE